ncbi:hypothetical protein [Caulobacter sp. FWC2]|uniref:hypothetical protein n=1 Tax=Caulobacter sp. FWC2 TaxID=69664 RepID=UPI000C149E98|nr:hypothetical protein [Caulobacter sp. FWC2]PIB90905.1 hypothetical protein CSW62_04570 [Caulobacter sp. FWC2]
MPEPVYAILPAGAALGLLLALIVMAVRPQLGPRAWVVPAVLSAAFLIVSLDVVAKAGPLGFWNEHLRGPWGAQIWCDLLLAAGTALAMLLPRARAVGMRAPPWIVLVAATGSIGLLAMMARCLFLESRAASSATLEAETAR